MGLGFERNGGELLCVDVDTKMVAAARDNIQRVRLQKTVTIVEGDALAVIPKLPGKFDFVFIDAVKEDYLDYLRAVEPKLKSTAVIVADNVIQFAPPDARLPQGSPAQSALPRSDRPGVGGKGGRHGGRLQGELAALGVVQCRPIDFDPLLNFLPMDRAPRRARRNPTARGHPSRPKR